MVFRFLCCRLLPTVVALTAIFVGYLLSTDFPLGTLFWFAYQPVRLLKSRPTPEVPPDAQPLPRPAEEMFRELPGGALMPANGIGMCCRGTAYHDESVRRTVLWYLLLGGRHIDTAAIYLNHRPIGQAIREAMDRGVPRSEIFVTTKVFPNFFGTNRTTAWIPQMLDELQLDYVDLVLLHAPRRWMGFYGGEDEFEGCCGCRSPRECREQTWQVLSEAREKGIVRNVGVSNFRIHQMEELRALGLAPIAVNQLQYHPWVPDWQREIADYCREHGIQLTAYFSLGGAQNAGSTALVDTLTQIGTEHETTVQQVLLRWALQSNLTIIPGTGNPEHMKQNLAAYSFSLTSDEMEVINSLGSDEDFRKNFMFFDMAGEL